MLTRPPPEPAIRAMPRPPAQSQWRDALGPFGALRRDPVRSISVVTVCYNARDCIRLTLESVKRQTFPNIEHVIIDGGSKDGTQNIVREYNVAYFVSEPDKGIYDAMEKGARAARGDIVIFLNAGDLFYDRDVCADVAKFFPEAGADLVFGNLMPAYLRPSDSHDHGAFRAGDLLNLSYYSNRRRIYDESIHHQATFYRRWIFSRASYYCEAPEANGEYNVLMCAVLRHHATVKHLPRPISRFMLGGTSTKDFSAEWGRYLSARDALRRLFCPRREEIPIRGETEFHHVAPEPLSLRLKKGIKAAIKRSLPFRIYERLALGLSMRAAGAVQPHLAALGAGLDRLEVGTQRNFALIGGVLDRVDAQAAARQSQLAQLARELRELQTQVQAAEGRSRAVEDLVATGAKSLRVALEREMGVVAARLDSKLTPVELAVAQASERFSAELGRVEAAAEGLRALMERQLGDLAARLDSKLTPVELAVAQASERFSAELGRTEAISAEIRDIVARDVTALGAQLVTLRHTLGSAVTANSRKSSSGDSKTLGAYSLCYFDGDWLAANIRRLYHRVDQFSVVIGPSERAYGLIQPPDTRSEQILRALPDPERKIQIYSSASWDHKNAMTAVATSALTTEFVMQLDADEFMPHDALDAALYALSEGAARVFVPHWIFWGDAEHVLVHPERGPHYFVPPRFFRRVPAADLGHFDGRYHMPDGSAADLDGFDFCISRPLWHFGWVGMERVARKFRFYREGRKLAMPSDDELERWIGSGRPSITLTLGPNTLQVRPYDGVMDESLTELVRYMARQ